MAFSKSHSKPQYSVSTSVSIRKGKYVKGPSFGLWLADSGPMARGTVKEDYLGELIAFLKKAHANDQGVAFALFKNKPKRDEDDDRDDDDDDDDDAEDEKPAKKKKRPAEDDDDEKPAKKKAKKKSDWDFDDDDE